MVSKSMNAAYNVIPSKMETHRSDKMSAMVS